MWKKKLIWLPGLWMGFVVFMWDHKLLFKMENIAWGEIDDVTTILSDQAEGQKLRGEWDKMKLSQLELIDTSLMDVFTFHRRLIIEDLCVMWHQILWHTICNTTVIIIMKQTSMQEIKYG